MHRILLIGLTLTLWCSPAGAQPGQVEVLRDRWGVPHVFAAREADGFFGLGYASAEDRLLQMELLRRRATGRLAEVFGPKWVESDRKFRLAGIGAHCADAFANLPAEMQEYLRAYAAGVNAFAQAHPERVRKRFAPLGTTPEPWTPSDCLAAWMGMAELFDRWVKEEAVDHYYEFQRLVADVGEAEALKRRGMVLDDAGAVVPEAEMAKDKEVYARLKARKPVPGFELRPTPDEPVRFSHAWAVDGTRSTTGKPLLESDPQTSVNNPPLFYEFHLAAGRYDVRGLGPTGCPALLIGWNRQVAWGATALGGGCTVTFLDRLSADARGYQFRGQTIPFACRFERIDVKGGEPVVQEVLTSRHGFVFNALARQNRSGQAYVSHFRQVQDRGTSVRALLLWMRAASWTEFRAAMEHYYSPGLHLVYADAAGNIAYQTLVHVPRTKRTPRLALEGWTGEDEVTGRIPLAELPHMLNPEAHFISHANNLPVGSWYPYDLGLAKGGIGDSVRSLRLRQLLTGSRKFSVEDFEAVVHRDNVNPAVSALLPLARKVVEEDKVTDRAVRDVLKAVQDWDLRYDASDRAYPAAVALAEAGVPAYRRSGLQDRLGGGEAGVCHLARLLSERFTRDGATPRDPAVRAYLVNWLRLAAEGAQAGPVPEVHAMPYQAGGPLGFPSLDPKRDLVSPPLTCGLIGTIWSQRGNSYTQIVDLADVDNSRSVLPPGISEDPESPFHANQIPLWVKGMTHPAPLSRPKVEAVAVSRLPLAVVPYQGPDSGGDKVVERPLPKGVQVFPAIPATPPIRAPGQRPGR
jgi:penicillin amidase